MQRPSRAAQREVFIYSSFPERLDGSVVVLHGLDISAGYADLTKICGLVNCGPPMPRKVADGASVDGI
jgi:hypothetical protein